VRIEQGPLRGIEGTMGREKDASWDIVLHIRTVAQAISVRADASMAEAV